MKRYFYRLWAAPLLVAACADAGMYSGDTLSERGVVCGGIYCQPGFHCEFDACVADPTTPGDTGGGGTPTTDEPSPLASGRYVFELERDLRRIVRIDSLSLEVASFTAGLAPMDLGVVGSRELTVLLDALDVVEVLDHRTTPPANAAWPTARSLSHLALAPSGLHAVAYYDWDDPRAQLRQELAGNINQVTILWLGDGAEPFADSDSRVQNVAVGFLPLEVRFAADGSRAVIISRDGLTPIVLGGLDAIAAPQPIIPIARGAAEIVIDRTASTAVLRYAGAASLTLFDLATGEERCLGASAAITDVDIAGDTVIADVNGAHIGTAPLAAATPDCASLDESLTIGNATRLAVDAGAGRAIAFEPALATESLWNIDLVNHTAARVQLEKAVAAVAFAGDARHVLLAHMKAPGTPEWDPAREDPDLSVDKSYGVSWLDQASGAHRLAVSDAPFGRFAFVPPDPRDPEPLGATYQAVLDPERPALLRVTHRPGFDDRFLDLAAMPRELGFLGGSRRTYVTQDHPWGRVTFLDPDGSDLRHVTGFAMENQ